MSIFGQFDLKKGVDSLIGIDLFDSTSSDLIEIKDEKEVDKLNKIVTAISEGGGKIQGIQSGLGVENKSLDDETITNVLKDRGVIFKEGKYYKEKPAQAPAAPMDLRPQELRRQSAPTPPMESPSVRGYRNTDPSPYETPKYLTNSNMYNQAVGRLITGLLGQSIRDPNLQRLL